MLPGSVGATWLRESWVQSLVPFNGVRVDCGVNVTGTLSSRDEWKGGKQEKEAGAWFWGDKALGVQPLSARMNEHITLPDTGRGFPDRERLRQGWGTAALPCLVP